MGREKEEKQGREGEKERSEKERIVNTSEGKRRNKKEKRRE